MTEHIFRENKYWLYKEESHFINELKKKDAGKELKFIDINSAMYDLAEKAENGDV